MTIPTTQSTLHTPDFGLNSDPAPREPWCPVTHHATQFIHDKIPANPPISVILCRVCSPPSRTRPNLTPNGITPFLSLFEGERQAVSKLGSSARSSVRAEALIAPVSYGATMRTMQSTLPVISGTSKQPPKRRLRAPFTVARFVSISHGQITV